MSFKEVKDFLVKEWYYPALAVFVLSTGVLGNRYLNEYKKNELATQTVIERTELYNELLDKNFNQKHIIQIYAEKDSKQQQLLAQHKVKEEQYITYNEELRKELFNERESNKEIQYQYDLLIQHYQSLVNLSERRHKFGVFKNDLDFTFDHKEKFAPSVVDPLYNLIKKITKESSGNLITFNQTQEMYFFTIRDEKTTYSIQIKNAEGEVDQITIKAKNDIEEIVIKDEYLNGIPEEIIRKGDLTNHTYTLDVTNYDMHLDVMTKMYSQTIENIDKLLEKN